LVPYTLSQNHVALQLVNAEKALSESVTHTLPRKQDIGTEEVIIDKRMRQDQTEKIDTEVTASSERIERSVVETDRSANVSDEQAENDVKPSLVTANEDTANGKIETKTTTTTANELSENSEIETKGKGTTKNLEVTSRSLTNNNISSDGTPSDREGESTLKPKKVVLDTQQEKKNPSNMTTSQLDKVDVEGKPLESYGNRNTLKLDDDSDSDIPDIIM